MPGIMKDVEGNPYVEVGNTRFTLIKIPSGDKGDKPTKGGRYLRIQTYKDPATSNILSRGNDIFLGEGFSATLTLIATAFLNLAAEEISS